MESLNGSINFRNLCRGRQLSVPFTSPIMFNNFQYNNIPNAVRSLGQFSKLVQEEGQQKSHRKISSDTSFHLEEDPSWLEDLLDEPAELPVKKGGNLIPNNPNSNADHDKKSNMMWDLSSGFPVLQASTEILGTTTQKADQMVKPDETLSYKATPLLNPDAKRAKQQANHRSRVRKLQYIAELERCVQVLQIQGLGVSAELEFLDQQNLILGMENRALKHRLDSISQEQLLRCLEQDMLEREIARLRNLHQQQQLQIKQPTRRLPKNRELDCQFAGMSINCNVIGSLLSN